MDDRTSGPEFVHRSFACGIHVDLLTPGRASGPLPVILYLHGIGESGDDHVSHLDVGLVDTASRRPDHWPFAILAPQKPTREAEWHAHLEALMQALDAASESVDVDPDRCLIAGSSQGGHGALRIAAETRQRWAGIVSVCPYVQPPREAWIEPANPDRWHPNPSVASALAEALHGTPVRCYHGDADDIVPYSHAQTLLRAWGSGDFELITLAGTGHDAWVEAFEDETLAAWMLAQRRGSSST